MAINNIITALLVIIAACGSQSQRFTINKTGCFKTKGCISFPGSCSSSDDCDYLVTYAARKDHVIFELSSKNEYAGFGLNDKASMDGTGAIVCSKADNVSSALVGHYLLHHHNPPSISKPTPSGLTDMSGAYENGRIVCRFQRSIKATPPMIYDLTSKHYFMYARGYTSASGGLTHHVWRSISEGKQPVTTKGPVKQSNDVMIAIHAGLMLLAWIGCAPVGMVIARYMKLLLGNQTCCNVKLWFQLHRGCMMLTSVFTIAGYVVIFIYVDGWSQTAGWHAIIGTVVVSLATIQPVIALFRPNPGNDRRYIFNWIHRCIACTVFVLAMANCFLGVNLFNQVPLTSHLGFCVISSFIVGYVAVLLIYEVYMCCRPTKKDEHDRLLDNDHNGQKGAINSHIKSKDKVVDLVYLSFTILIAVGICATLIALLVISTVKQLRG